MSPVRAVLFDYGHTIIDFKAAEENLLSCYDEVRRVLTAQASRSLPEVPHLIERVSRRVGTLIMESYEARELEELDIVNLFDTALRSMGVEIPREVARQIAEMEHRALFSALSAPPENLEVLMILREEGLKLGLVSNAALLAHLMHEDISRLGIAQHMDAAVFSSEVGVRKPHPAIFMRVLDAIGVAPAEAAFIGDRLHEDVGGAQRVGMRGILTRQYRAEPLDGANVKPDHVVDRLPDVVPYVKSL